MQLITGVTGFGLQFSVLGQQEDEDDNPVDLWTVGFWANGDWRSEVDIHFKPVSLCPVPGTVDNWVVLGTNGQVLWINSASTDPTTNEARIEGSDPIAFTQIRPFENGVAATQLGRKIFWTDGGEWRPLGTDLPPSKGGKIVGFESFASIDGQMCGAGWMGEIWWMRNKKWAQQDSPVNTILTSVAPFDEEVIICGRLGVILRGRENQWRIVDHQQTDEDFWSVVTYKDRIYLSSLRAIYELRDEKLHPIDDESETGSYYHLSANDDFMISVGAYCVLTFDGQTWQQVF